MRRMTLLLGPPGSGKTTLLLALAGRLDKSLKVLENFPFLFLCVSGCQSVTRLHIHSYSFLHRRKPNESQVIDPKRDTAKLVHQYDPGNREEQIEAHPCLAQ